MLSHVINSEAGAKGWEAHVDSLFRVTFIPPAKIINSQIMTEQCRSCTGWKFPGPDHTVQSFMQAKRTQASTEVDNIQELEMIFELNLNDTYQNFVYNLVTDWKKLVFNPLTGERGLKKDFMGKIVVESFAANGEIYWTRTVHNIWPKGNLESIGQNNYDEAEPVKLSTNWVGEYFTEQRY